MPCLLGVVLTVVPGHIHLFDCARRTFLMPRRACTRRPLVFNSSSAAARGQRLSGPCQRKLVGQDGEFYSLGQETRTYDVKKVRSADDAKWKHKYRKQNQVHKTSPNFLKHYSIYVLCKQIQYKI